MGLLKWALLFLVLAAVAALFGFGNLAADFADIAKILAGVFLVIVLIFVALGVTVYKKVT